MVAWIVLIVSALVILGFFALLAFDDWRAFLFAITLTVLMFGAVCGLMWSIETLLG